MITGKPIDIDAYITEFPRGTQLLLEQVRMAIRKAAPDAEEAISYGMPTFKLHGKSLVYFAGFAHHIGFYPVPSGIEALKKELSAYKQGKGSVQFPLDKKMPLALIARIVKFRMRASSPRRIAKDLKRSRTKG